MDWELYAKQLEEIIESIELKESTRILVDALVKQARKKAEGKPAYKGGKDGSDLMIGDWCAYGVNCKGRVTALTDHLITLSVDGNEINGLYMLMPDMIRPIPLTEEILANNGWRKEPTTIDGDYANWHGEIPICQEEDEFNYERIELTYVHQLQHLLRIVGVQREIEL